MVGRIISVSVIISLLFIVSLSAQPGEWGKLTDEELLMEGSAEDPEADVVILFNTCRIQITPDFDLEVFITNALKFFPKPGKNMPLLKSHFGTKIKYIIWMRFVIQATGKNIN